MINVLEDQNKEKWEAFFITIYKHDAPQFLYL